MATLLVFRDMGHYRDWFYKLQIESKIIDGNGKSFDVMAPMKFMIDLLDINWGMYYGITKEWRNGNRCPFCFWNGNRSAYQEPKLVPIQRQDGSVKNSIQERWAICPCRLYDLNYIDLHGKKADKREMVYDHREWFAYLNIDWEQWCERLRSNRNYHQEDERQEVFEEAF